MNPALRRVGRTLISVLPTRRLALAFTVAAPVWLLSSTTAGAELASAVVVLLAAAAIADALTTPARWQVVAERRFPERVGLGDEEPGVIVIASRARRPLRVAVFTTRVRGIDTPSPAGWHRVPADGSLTVPVSVTGRERGAWGLGPIVVRVQGSLGLMQRTIRFEPGDQITVVPSMSGVRRYRLLALHHRLHQMGLRAVRRRGDGTNFSHLREYVVGDDPRHIDWKASARRDQLITREFTVEQGQTVLIVIDAGRMMTQLEEGVPRFEYALSSAMLLADVATQSRDLVGAMAFDDAVRAWVPPTRGRDALERLRRALIPLAASMTEPDYATAFRLIAERQRKRSLIVMFTDVLDVESSRSLIALTARSAARHLVLVVAIRNDRLIAEAVPPASATSTRVYEAAAAEELVLAREDALIRMRRAGASVVDVSPRAMTAAVVNRYLEIKARASL